MDKAYDEDKFSDEDSDEKRSVDSDVNLQGKIADLFRYLNLTISWISLKKMKINSKRPRREMKVLYTMKTNQL